MRDHGALLVCQAFFSRTEGHSCDTSPAGINHDPPKPSLAEQRAIDDAVLRLSERTPRLALRLRQNASGTVTVLGPEHSDHQGWVTRLEDVFGTHGPAFAAVSLNQLMAICQDKAGTIDAAKLKGLIAAIEGARPVNEVQAMLAV